MGGDGPSLTFPGSANACAANHDRLQWVHESLQFEQHYGFDARTWQEIYISGIDSLNHFFYPLAYIYAQLLKLKGILQALLHDNFFFWNFICAPIFRGLYQNCEGVLFVISQGRDIIFTIATRDINHFSYYRQNYMQ